jgi:uncharacterized protein (DUF2236 family)
MELDRTSVMWRYAGDARMLPFLGRAFLLQAAHPTIAAGVADHSDFKVDPFGRFRRSWGLVLDALYAADSERVAAEIRASHKPIRGVRSDGRRYSAFEPEAYFWVLASGFETIVSSARRFGRPFSAAEERRGYEETRELGSRLGLRERDMPDAYESFQDWYAWMLAERIDDNQTVRDVLAVLRRPNPPRGVPAIVWPLPRVAVAELGWLATVGTLPASVRARLRIPWGPVDEIRLRAVAQAFKLLNAAPAGFFYLPPARAAFKRVKLPAAGAREGRGAGQMVT